MIGIGRQTSPRPGNSAQATSGSVCYQPYRGMDLKRAHQEDLRAAKFVTYFCTCITFLWNTPQTFCLLSMDCYYLSRLINNNRGIKASACVHHIASVLSQTISQIIFFTCTVLQYLIKLRANF